MARVQDAGPFGQYNVGGIQIIVDVPKHLAAFDGLSSGVELLNITAMVRNMAKQGKVDWYANDVLLVVEGATDELLTQLAFYVEGEAKVNAPVDTGFLRNAIYTIAPGRNNRDEAQATASALAERYLAPLPDLQPHEAAVHAAAEYTIYQEMVRSFLYSALEKARAVTPGIIQEVGRAKL